MKSRRMRLAGNVARVVRGEVRTELWWGNMKERDHLVKPGLVWRIILSWIFRKWDVGAWTGWIWPTIGTGTCECGNESSGSVKCWEYFN